MPVWNITVEQCPNGSGIKLQGVMVFRSGVGLIGYTDVNGFIQLTVAGDYSFLKSGYYTGIYDASGGGITTTMCLPLLGGGGGGGGGTDPGAPDAPSDLVAVAVSDTEIDLSWTDNSSDEDEFVIERSPDGVVDWVELSTVGADTTAFGDTGLTAGTTYYYRIVARNGSGDSAPSDVANATTTGGAGAAPTAPSELSAEAVSSSRIRLTWRDNADDEAGFRVERSADGVSGWIEVGVVAANVTAFTNTGLAAETLYYYRVRAYSDGGSSAYSNVASAITPAVGVGECTVTPYATVGDVQARVWTDIWTVTDSSQPARSDVEDWLCQISHWMDAQIRWRYEIPVTDASDREILRPVCALLVAGMVWDMLITRNAGQEQRSTELKALALTLFVWYPAGVGTFHRGGSAVIVGKDPFQLGKSNLVLPNSTESSTGEAELGQPLHTFREPGVGSEPARFFGRNRIF